jgi:hypothetical protein
MNEWEAYLPFCQSERQAQVIRIKGARAYRPKRLQKSMGIN